MPVLRFLPQDQNVDVEAETKILAAAIRAKINLRFSCGSCQCGTCAIRIKLASADASVSKSDAKEQAMLLDLGIEDGGQVRMACKTKIIAGTVEVDLSFQDTYDPSKRRSVF